MHVQSGHGPVQIISRKYAAIMPEKNDALANAIASLPEHLRAQTISKMDKRARYTEEGDLTDKFAKVLTELFHSFDSDGDGCFYEGA